MTWYGKLGRKAEDEKGRRSSEKSRWEEERGEVNTRAKVKGKID